MEAVFQNKLGVVVIINDPSVPIEVAAEDARLL